MNYLEWTFHNNTIIHVPCNKKAIRFHGTHGKIWCNKCSARFPDELEDLADFIYEKEELRPLEFYGWTGYFYLPPIIWPHHIYSPRNFYL